MLCMWCHLEGVGCCWFSGTSKIRQIGLTGKERNNAINEMSDTVEQNIIYYG